MKCARCSAEVPSQSQFCMRCGTPIHPGVNPNVTGVTPPATIAPSTNRPLVITAIVLALAVAVLAGVVVEGKLLQKPAANVPNQLVQAPAQGSAGTLVQAPAETNTGTIVQAPADPAKPAPIVQTPVTKPDTSDIDDYLRFVKQIEMSKQALVGQELGNFLKLLTDAKALSASIDEDQYKSTFGNMRTSFNYSADQWNLLTTKFNSKTPPQSCIDLRNKYLDQLGKIQASIVQVNESLSKVQSDPGNALQALTSMEGKSSAEIDSAVQAADDALADVCKQYNLHKDFDIRGDSGTASLFR